MKRRITAAIMIVLAIALGVTVASPPQIRLRARVLVMKAGGGLPDVEWLELVRMLRPQSSIDFESLSNTRNVFASISNPYTSSKDVEGGGAIFRARCTVCHEPTGSGDDDTKVKFGRGEYRHGGSDWALYRAIERGIPGTAMRGHSDLGDEKLWQLVAFLRSLTKGRASEEAGRSSAAQISLPPVTSKRLLAADSEPQNWLTYSGTYDGHRNSRLAEINRANVSGLRVQWVYQMSTAESVVEASPLVADGVMYVVEPPNDVVALDADNGNELWRYERKLSDDLSLCCGRVNRGVALLDDRVFVATLDAHLVALDARTGHVVWDAEIADSKNGYSATAAPLAVDDKIVVGISGGEIGIRGFLDAYDAKSGKRAWRFYTIPEPGRPGGDTWEGDSWKTGGGPTWMTGSYDPDLGLVYWGVGNPWPDFRGNEREGDNLYTNSVVALDARTGELKWHFQFLPHDLWDYDANAVPVLVDQVFDGRARKLLVMALKSGFAYVVDRQTGEFLRATEITRQNWAKGIDAKGRPIRNEAADPTVRGTIVYPGAGGGANWWPPSFNPATGLVYVPVVERGQLFTAGSAVTRVGTGKFTLGSTDSNIEADPGHSALRALNVSTGELRWEHLAKLTRSGTMTTAGGLVFWSEDEDVLALDAESGKVLWRFNTGGDIRSAPTTYTVGGAQRVSIAAGRSIFTFGLSGQHPAK